MVTNRWRGIVTFVLGLSVFFGIVWSAEELPTRISDETFWNLVTTFSEPEGSFPSDNFVSNELLYQHVLSDLTKTTKPGGAYVGVGPDQNFTYIVALRPRIAFIVDIRRMNMVEHLMYKALFELSADRAEFLSRLFSRARPADVDKDSSVEALFAAFRETEPDPKAYEENLQAIKRRLINDHGFHLIEADERQLEYIFSAFYIGGPKLTYGGPRFPAARFGNGRYMPTYEELMMEVDNDGEHRSYLATEGNFLELRQLEKDNLVIPLVGDFGGPTCIRSVGEYLKSHNASVSAFYTSNVEQYLFLGGDGWKKFYANVSTLPLDPKGVFIRALIKTDVGEYSASPTIRAGFRLETALYSIGDLLAAFDTGMIQTYYDVVQMGR
jgi:hypothetical protein